MMAAENITLMALNVSANVTTLNCPVYNKSDDHQIGQLAIWIEGISQFIVATFGLIGNFISAFILSRLLQWWGKQAAKSNFMLTCRVEMK